MGNEQQVDEYGIPIPQHHETWMEKGCNAVAMDDDDSAIEKVFKGIATPFACLGGAILDEIPGVNGTIIPGPFSEIAHASRESREYEEYQRQRAAAEAAANAAAQERNRRWVQEGEADPLRRDPLVVADPDQSCGPDDDPRLTEVLTNPEAHGYGPLDPLPQTVMPEEGVPQQEAE